MRIYDPSRWREPTAEVARLPLAAPALAYVPAQDQLLVASDPPTLWELSGASVGRVDTMVGLSGAVGWSGADVTTIDRHHQLRAWSVHDGSASGQWDAVLGAVSPDPDTWVILDRRGTLRSVSRSAPEKPGWRVDAGGEHVAQVGPWTLTAGEGGVSVWGQDGASVRRWSTGPVEDLIGAGDAAVLVFADHLELRAAPGGELLARRAGRPRAVAAQAAGSAVAVASDTRVTLCRGPSMTDCEDVAIPAGRSAPVALALSPDGQRLALGWSRTVSVVEGEREIGRVPVDVGTAPALAFSPDGDTLAVAGTREWVELWDLRPMVREVDELEREVRLRYGPTAVGRGR